MWLELRKLEAASSPSDAPVQNGADGTPRELGGPILLASRAAIAKACADCGLEDCGLQPASWRFRDLGPPRGPLS
eukprot:7750110-Alexandrium_andersonii.AAC.1